MRKNRLLILLLLFVPMVMFCACGGGSGNASGDGAADGSVVETAAANEDYFEWDVYGSNENYIKGLTEEGAKQTSLVIPERCEGFSGSPFYGDDISVETVTFESDGDISLGSGFSSMTSVKTVVLPAELSEINDMAFYGSTALESIIIPSGVTVIGDSAFMNCSSLREVTIEGSGLTEIGSEAFFLCSALENIYLPTSITTIGVSAFERCSALSEITLPESLISLGEDAFLASGLTDIYMPEGLQLEEYGSSSFLADAEETTVHVVNGSWAGEQQSLWEDMGLTVSVE